MILNLKELPRPVDFEALFGRNAPIEIEIGVGKGLFLKQYAAAHPHLNLLGIERSGKWLRHAAVRLEKAEIPNIRLVEGYVEPFLRECVPDERVSNFHVYFPDPWPKRRHYRRRLFQLPLMLELLRTLKPEGELFLATDHEEYFHVIQETWVEAERFGWVWRPSERGPFVTNFQAKYEREGRPIFFLHGKKDTKVYTLARKRIGD